jgi:hypothetical protein
MVSRRFSSKVAAVELLRNAWFVVQFDPVKSFFHVVRSAVPFETLDDMKRRFDEVSDAIDHAGRADAGLLVDTRAAAPRNDPAFEKAFAPLRARLFGGLSRRAVLVRTPIGRLQVDRHQREDQNDIHVFQDEELAVAYCTDRTPAAPMSARRRVSGGSVEAPKSAASGRGRSSG